MIAAGAAWRFLTSRLGLGLIVAMALGLLWLRGDHYQRDRDAWRSAYKAQQQATIAVAAEARAKAEAQRIATENRDAQLARKADHETQDIRNLRGAADRFAADRRLRPQEAGPAPGGPGAPAQGDPAPGGDRSGATAVVLTRPEYEQFVANTLRLEQVRRWGEALILDGLAIPEVQFGAQPPQGKARGP